MLLNKERQHQFAAQWRQQQKLRKRKKPAALTAYETLHKQATALLARCWSSASRTKAEQATLIKLQTKCVVAIERANAEIAKQTKKRAASSPKCDETTLTSTVLASAVFFYKTPVLVTRGIAKMGVNIFYAALSTIATLAQKVSRPTQHIGTHSLYGRGRLLKIPVSQHRIILIRIKISSNTASFV